MILQHRLWPLFWVLIWLLDLALVACTRKPKCVALVSSVQAFPKCFCALHCIIQLDHMDFLFREISEVLWPIHLCAQLLSDLWGLHCSVPTLSGRAAFLFVLHWLTMSCLSWLPASHCFAVPLCSNSHSKLNRFWALLRNSVVWCLSTESYQPDLTKGTVMSYSQSLPECPSDSIILAWKWSKKLVWLIARWLFRIRFLTHDAVKWPLLCSSVHSAHTALSQICHSSGNHGSSFHLSVFSPCEKYGHTT